MSNYLKKFLEPSHFTGTSNSGENCPHEPFSPEFFCLRKARHVRFAGLACAAICAAKRFAFHRRQPALAGRAPYPVKIARWCRSSPFNFSGTHPCHHGFPREVGRSAAELRGLLPRRSGKALNPASRSRHCTARWCGRTRTSRRGRCSQAPCGSTRARRPCRKVCAPWRHDNRQNPGRS